MPRSILGKLMELDLQTVDAILSGESSYLSTFPQFDLPSLDLSNFRRCSDSALDRLVSHIGPLDYFFFGVEDLPLGHALKLRRLKIGFLTLPNLVSLDDDAAYALGGWEFGSKPIRTFDITRPISAKAARGLVGKAPPAESCDSPLHISLLSLSPDVADALRQHTHELSLSIRDGELTPEVAEILAKHDGYELQIWLPHKISEEAQIALSRNPSKRISIQKDGALIYVVDCDWWSSSYEERMPPLDIEQLEIYFDRQGIQRPDGERLVLDVFLAKRLMKDGLLPTLDRGAHLDLSVFTDITPETLAYLTESECLGVSLGMRRLDIQSAKLLSGWNTRYMSFADGTEFSPVSLNEFRGFAGNLYLGQIGSLDQMSAEALASLCGEVSFSVPSLSIEVADALAMHSGRLSVRGLKLADEASLTKLVCHRGDRLTVMLDFEPNPDCIRAITSNPDKRVYRFKGEVYEALNSHWAAMICSPDTCADFVRSYNMTDADIVAPEVLEDAIGMDVSSIEGVGN